MDIEKIKQEYLEIFYDNIERDGAEEILNYLEKSDFFTAPASSRFHSNFAGGLCLHHVIVYKRFLSLVQKEFGKDWEKIISAESVAIIALLHDICKTNFYIVETRNVKVDGQWIQKPYYKAEDPLPRI